MEQRSDRDQREAFEALALPFMEPLYNKAYRMSRNPDDASEIVQETYLRAYRTFSNFKPGTNCKAWLFKIMYSVFINRYRKTQREPAKVSVDELEEKFHYTLADAKSDGRETVLQNPNFDWKEPEVDNALNQLAQDFRAAVMLVDVEGFSYDEAASILDCPVGTVRSRLYRARKELYVSLQEYARDKGFLKVEGG